MFQIPVINRAVPLVKSGTTVEFLEHDRYVRSSHLYWRHGTVSVQTRGFNYTFKLGLACYYQEMAPASVELSPFVRSVIDFSRFVECKS